MTDPIFVALGAITLLLVKHFVCDFVLQTVRHVQFKGIYGHPAGIEHSAIHAIGTAPCLWLFGATPLMIVAIAAAEFVVHYHVDWLKEQIGHRTGWTAADKGFWIAIGADQLVHNLTYVGIVAVLLRSRF
ncbi:MAG: uncharacterized protein JWN71_213 [Xanthobacteraceae bacterium]|jgi:hypothetical protein|nr:uncharacterized protein [Xanthobacteraceae bacterium]